MKLILLIFACLLFQFLLIDTVNAQSAIKIIPIGDSITHGVKNGSSDPENLMAGYRYYLSENLANLGYKIDFAGELSSGPVNFSDQQHAGYNGFDTQQLLGVVTDSSLNQLQPQYALILAGLNDLAQPRTDAFRQGVSGRFEQLLNRLSAHNITAIVATTPYNNINAPLPDNSPSSLSLTQWLNDYNQQTLKLVAKKASEGQKIALVDMSLAINPQTSDISDGVHPGEVGYQKMADVWTNGFNQLIRQPQNTLIANRSVTSPGGKEAVSWANLVSPQETSWVGLYKADSSISTHTNYINWMYLSTCTQNHGTEYPAPLVGLCIFPISQNISEGTYEFRLFLEGTTLAQRSNQFFVNSSGAVSGPSPIPPVVNVISGDLVVPFGKVDIFDFNQLVSDFGKTGNNLAADIVKTGSSSNKIDIFDFNLMVSNFGKMI